MPDSSQHVEKAIAAARELGLKGWLARCLNLKAIPLWSAGKYESARAVYDEALAIFTGVGDERGIALVQMNLAEQEFSIGNVQRALELASEGLATNRRLGRLNSIATGLCNLAAYRIAAGDIEGGRDAAREALRTGQAAQNSTQIAWACQHLSQIGAERGDVEGAARLIGYVDAVLRDEGHQREPTEKLGFQNLMAALCAKLSDSRIAALGAEGAAWSEDQAVQSLKTSKVGSGFGSTARIYGILNSSRSYRAVTPSSGAFDFPGSVQIHPKNVVS